MRIFFVPRYWNPILADWTPLPEGFEVQIFDEDIGFHDRVGTATTTGGVMSAEVSDWGPEAEPEFFFRIPTRGLRIDLQGQKRLTGDEQCAGPVLLLPRQMWDSRKHGPNELLRMQDWLMGRGREDDPLEVRLEAGGAFFRALYWNRIAEGPSSVRGAHLPVPGGVTFHLVDRRGRTVGRGCAAADGRVYVPVWESGHTEVSLRLDADYKEPLVIDLEQGTIATAAQRDADGHFLTLTSWSQGTPVLRPSGILPPYTELRGGWAGSPGEPIEVDVSAEPWTHGNKVEALIDGDETYKGIVAALKTAQHTIHICSWDFDPRVWVDRLSGSTETLEDVLLNLVAERPALKIRVLNWPDPTPAGMKAEKTMKARLAADPRNADGRLMVRLDSPSPITRSHHQKLVTIDDRIGFCGGIDFAWGRWDTPDHAVHAHRQAGDPESYEEGDTAWPPWHDVHCRVEGPVVATLVHNFRTRWRYVTWEELGRAEAGPPLPGGVPAMATRTWPEGVPGGDDPIRDELAVKNLLLRWISSARDYVLIEQQYLFSKRMAKALARKLRWARGAKAAHFRMIVVLPPFFGEPKGATAKMHFMQHRSVQIMKRADPEGEHLRLFTLRTWDGKKGDYTPVYIHAKTMIVDDEWVTIGSANMGNRSLRYDTEFNLAAARPELAKDLRLRLWNEHARGPLPDLPVPELVDHLAALAQANGAALERLREQEDPSVLGDDPAARRLFPYNTDGHPLDLPIPDFLF